MHSRSPDKGHFLTRRHLLGALPATALLMTGTALPRMGHAEETSPPPASVDMPATAQQFSFDLLGEEMQALATQPYKAAPAGGGFLDNLTYDDYRLIRFNPERARWADEKDNFFELQAFHMGWLFKEPVLMYEVVDGQAQKMGFGTDDFIYQRQIMERVPPHAQLPGVAGFRLHVPLNRPDIHDELVAFVGASYFRALGRGSAYGLSARGLAINTGLDQAEEFPRFSRFYMERPAPGAREITLYATLESPSVTGAYRFVITPGADTEMAVTARLYFRGDIAQLGVAPLTSMFLFADRNRAQFDDFRPNVHDSDGLQIIRRDGDRLWRPLANPPRLASSYFTEESPRGFGLMQRDREFDHYQDASAHYERRPSAMVTPVGDWGKGVVRLVEIPSDLEVNDNIVAFWVPEGAVKAGESREYSYILQWGDLPSDPQQTRAEVLETWAGAGGVSGVGNVDGTRKFVIDFAGGIMAKLPADSDIKAITSITGGTIVTQTLSLITGGIWRLVLDVAAEGKGDTVELAAHIAGYGQKLSENWLYQWIRS
ncbi:glucan biosynthesis protein [Phaeovulum sp.]|uniref:glucan biosynthesis protein n=1 Tax=Phaeovulum sp. TaxID=2934796 RepID=UPI0039E2AEE1